MLVGPLTRTLVLGTIGLCASYSLTAPAAAPRGAAARRARAAVAPEMCGILAVSGSKKSLEVLKLETLTLQRLVRHRGPDGSGIHVIDNRDGTSSSIAHERLAIMDPLSGNQPLFSQDNSLSLAVNGEIYNYKELRARVGDESRFRTNSDCEPIVHLYEEVGDDIASYLDGDFAFVILNEETGALCACNHSAPAPEHGHAHALRPRRPHPLTCTA